MTKPYNWREEPDVITKADFDKHRNNEKILEELTHEAEELGLYADSASYKCSCGRMKPCRRHPS